MKRTFVALLLVAAVVFLPNAVNAEPTLADFSLKQERGELVFSFSYEDVAGGLSRATFSVGFVWEKAGEIKSFGFERGLELLPVKAASNDEESAVLMSGKFTSRLSFTVADQVQIGDKFKFFISLVDAAGENSNTVSGEFTFAGREI